mmetsp:Transcript_17423/g.25733  ORF Transcript_17423/g.25733 Transcript_17423/m.25733 type:complete len:161 (-) Transcript_17423:24-506(-)
MSNNDINTINSSIIPIYATTDNEEAKSLIRSKDPKSIKVTTIEPYHIDESQNRTKATEGNLNAWTEFMLLAEADCIVASRSGFSEVAVRISSMQQQQQRTTSSRCYAYFFECQTIHDITLHSSDIIATSPKAIGNLSLMPPPPVITKEEKSSRRKKNNNS